MDGLSNGRNGVSRRRIIAGGAALAAGSAAFAIGSGGAGASAEPWGEATARVEIEYLRRLYGQATDLLGPGKDRQWDIPDLAERRALGRQIYHRIFTTDATIIAGGSPPGGVVGPDAWADYVTNALWSFTATQHLIGTQLVTITQASEFIPGHGQTGGTATMQSYLDAMHEFAPGGNILIVRGTYFDKVRITPGIGWQIYDMNLAFLSSELREHTPPA